MILERLYLDPGVKEVRLSACIFVYRKYFGFMSGMQQPFYTRRDFLPLEPDLLQYACHTRGNILPLAY